MSAKASIVITTRNRKSDLEKAMSSAIAQKVDGVVEIIIIDDGSTDGTAEMVKTKFPQAKLHRSETSFGYITQRNFGAQRASAPIIFSIDDDACFSSDTIVADILGQFDSPEVGAIAIPFIDVCQDAETIRQKCPEGCGTFLSPYFIGTAHALRRDLFLKLGGYRETLFHQGEEMDYCLRMLESGCVVRLAKSDPIYHYECPRRDFRRMDVYGRRNNVLFGWHNVPSLLLPAFLVATTWNGLLHGWRVGRSWTMTEGLLLGYRAVWKERKNRSPVSFATFRLYRDLTRRSPVSYSEIKGLLART